MANRSFYVCDTYAGPGGGQPGSTINAAAQGSITGTLTDAQNPATPCRTLARLATLLGGDGLSELEQGDKVYFARGSCFSGVQVLNFESTTRASINSNPASVSNPIVFDAYTHPTYAASADPILYAASGTYMVEFSMFGNAAAAQMHGGYTFRNLHFHGGGHGVTYSGGHTFAGEVCTTGFHMRHSVRNVRFESCTIEYFGYGIQMSPPIYTVAVVDCIIRNNYKSGLLGCSQDFLMERNYIYNNNWAVTSFPDSGYYHGAYISSSSVEMNRVTIRNNHFDRNSRGGGTPCIGGNLTFHGVINGMIVENNIIEQDSNGGGCIGISLTIAYSSVEYFRHVQIRGNTLVNCGTNITISASPGIIIENNTIYDDGNPSGQKLGINGPDVFESTGDDRISDVVIRNNTFYCVGNTTSNCAFLRTSTQMGGWGTNGVVTNNLIHYGGTTADAFDFAAPGCFSSVKGNLLSNANWGDGNTTVSAGQTAFNAVAGAGVASDNGTVSFIAAATPSDANNWSVTPAAANGVINASVSSSVARLAWRGYARVSTADVGSCEYGSTP